MTAEPVEVEAFRSGQQLYAIRGGSGGGLAPGASLEWPLWLHPRAAGELTFHYVWCYEPLEPVHGMRHRWGTPSEDPRHIMLKPYLCPKPPRPYLCPTPSEAMSVPQNPCSRKCAINPQKPLSVP